MYATWTNIKVICVHENIFFNFTYLKAMPMPKHFIKMLKNKKNLYLQGLKLLMRLIK